MIDYPFLKEQPSARQIIDTFKGYNHNLRIGSGEFYEMENMTSDDYPVLSTRRKRGILSQSLKSCRGMYYVPGVGLFYTTIVEDGSTRLYLRIESGIEHDITEVVPASTKFALIGKKLVVAPDMICVDIESLAAYSLDEAWTVSEGEVSVNFCDADGNLYEIEPQNIRPTAVGTPSDGTLWLDISQTPVLKQYDTSMSQWIEIGSPYLKITGLGDHHFQAQDGVHISGFHSDSNSLVGKLNGSHMIHDAGHGEIVISGNLNEYYTQDCSAHPIKIERVVPRLDFLVESGNRLWGCKKDINEIYACKLGDIFNWNCFAGLSTDSWVGSVGTPGEFTGAAVQNGYPVFYKETCKHKVWPSSTGAHQITSVVCDGVEKNSDNSVAVLDGTVFYKSPNGVCADDGGGVTRIGQDLGDIHYSYACGAIFGRKYYLNMLDSKYKRHLFVYDIARRQWHLEDGPDDRHLCAGDGCLYSVSGSDLLDLTGKTGTPEDQVSWKVETGDLGLELPEQKYISRLTLRLSLEPGATLEVYVKYDCEPVWVKLGQVYGTDLRSFSLPVRPRRCDHLRLKLQGTGMCKVYSITKTLEKGSELT